MANLNKEVDLLKEMNSDNCPLGSMNLRKRKSKIVIFLFFFFKKNKIFIDKDAN